ncbi:MAG: FMN-binding negative transcriptional regulator [Rhodobacteraceae bacterium]|nr:FMN-binding negative transcriptional regulator [Paracoccaceae bacterium]
MHPNPAFRGEAASRHIALARSRSFGTLLLNGADGPLAAHVPFLLDAKAETLDLHLVRSNPILRELTSPQTALIAVAGADGYISPDWYEAPDQVPTWNYVAVHLRGTLVRLPDDRLTDVLTRQSAEYESRLAPKPPWTIDKMTPEALARMLRMIVPCRMTLASVDGTWKLGQNKPDAARLNAARAITDSDFGQEVAELSRLMLTPNYPTETTNDSV